MSLAEDHTLQSLIVIISSTNPERSLQKLGLHSKLVFVSVSKGFRFSRRGRLAAFVALQRRLLQERLGEVKE